MELGHRIEHLQILIDSTKDKVKKSDENQKIFRTFESDRIEKYLLMEDNINKAEKNYGKFSQNLSKNREIFSNINKVYLQIRNSTYGEWFFKFLLFMETIGGGILVEQITLFIVTSLFYFGLFINITYNEVYF